MHGGTVEATKSGALTTAGGTGAAVIAAVLLYRNRSAWGLVPLGWGLWRNMPKALVRSSSQMRDRPDRLAGAACAGDLAS